MRCATAMMWWSWVQISDVPAPTAFSVYGSATKAKASTPTTKKPCSVVSPEAPKKIHGVPVALEEAALIPELRGVLDADLGGGSLHGELERRGVVATRATGKITARLARASETELLDLAPQSALLVELRILFDQRGRVFERTETRYVADRYVIDVVHTHP